ncbi:MAG: galactosyltransferase-related protein [Methylobacter sp.]
MNISFNRQRTDEKFVSLASFKDAHKGETIIVCGCGESLNLLDHPERFVTIGVNDIGRRFHPDYLVVVNPRGQFSDDRFRYVETSRARYLFSQYDDLVVPHPQLIKFQLGTRGGTDFSNSNILHFTQNSPYIALCLAIHMGAKSIGLIGVDFTDLHFFAETGPHPLNRFLDRIDEEYKRLAKVVIEMGIEVVNLSSRSRLTAFPKKSIESFLSENYENMKTKVNGQYSSLRIVSYSKTPVAGVPPILARCISSQTEHSCECVWQRASYGNGVSFEGGVEWSEEPQRTEQLLEEADLVIVHNGYVVAQHQRILQNKPVITMAHNYGWNVDTGFVEKGMPGVVVGQYQATLPEFAGWQVVPNPVPLWEYAYQPEAKPDRFTVAYTPSGKHESYPKGHRLFWHSKGYDSTIRVLDRLAAEFPLQLEVIRNHQIPHAESLAMKRKAHVVIDECITGSYHRNSLEGLATGCIVINGVNFASKIGEAFAYCAGIDFEFADRPFLYASVDTLYDCLQELVVSNPEELLDIGKRNRAWMERHWNFKDQWLRCWMPAVERALTKSRCASHHPVRRDESQTVTRTMLKTATKLSIVIPHGGEDRFSLLDHTLQNLRKIPEIQEIIVVEMGVSASARTIMRENEQYIFIEDSSPFHKARLMNVGLRHAQGNMVLWLDNDLIVPQHFLHEAIAEKTRRKLNCLIAYSNTYFLSEADSQLVMKGTLKPENAVPVNCNSTQKGCRGGAVLVDREWAISFGGMREEFIGWGGEDDAWFYFSRYFGSVGVTEQPQQNLYHLFHHNSGGYGLGEQIANNPHYERNLLLIRKLMHMRRKSEVLDLFPVKPL